jgi:hypothetical protein
MRNAGLHSKAAELLKVSQATFFRKYKEYYGEVRQKTDGRRMISLAGTNATD